jgi:TMEM175 potassium channel family protein
MLAPHQADENAGHEAAAAAPNAIGSEPYVRTGTHDWRMTSARLETFSDGVFAIAITLLVLEFSVDTATHDLGAQMLHIWPSYLAYVTSFLTIGVIWVNHHVLFDLIDHVDRTLLFLNTLLLLVVAFTPFPTRLIAEFLREPQNEETAALVYGVTFVVMSVMFQLLWRWMSTGRRLIRPDVPQAVIDDITRAYLPGIPIYAGATLVALASPLASVVLYLAIALFYALPPSLYRLRT